MADFFFRVSPNIVLGSYTVSRLGYYASEMGTKFMVVLDPILRDVGLAEKVIKSLDDHKVEFFTFEAVNGAATTELLGQALTLARDAHVHGVIGVGGTQVLNLAKIVCEIFHETHYIYDFVEGA
ncbi:MAG: iron-containing alcohol dehydrogenase, partial [Treponemataceae bacterium]|nr:iron-containing alcohol dehydrogenase [Treponemataceae bacterium]